jgi:hypothetical protein
MMVQETSGRRASKKVTAVTGVLVLRPYGLRVVFSEGKSRDIDLRDELYGEIFEPLQDPSFFAQAFVDKTLGTVVWPKGADFSPEFLYHDAKALASA